MRCAVYIRVSKDNQVMENSLIYQEQLFVNLIKEKGWTLHKVYSDSVTGTKENKRTELKQLIEDAENSKFDIILAKELSRLARNVELAHKIKRIAEDNHINIITLDGAINTLERKDNQLFGLYAWLYEQEAQRTSERVKSSFRTKAKKGLVTGGHAAYGYYVKDGKLYIKDDNTPEIVRWIFDEYIKGTGLDTIARKLYERGVTSPGQIAGKTKCSDKWHGSSIKLILSNEVYIGNLVQGKETSINVTSTKRYKVKNEDIVRIENCHEAIVSKDCFDTVQKLLSERSIKKSHKQVHLFTNILFCADCGKGMHFKKNRKGYVCGSFNHHGKKACSDHIVRESELSDSILAEIRYFINCVKDDTVFKEFESTLKKHNKSYEKLISSGEKRLTNIMKEKSSLLSFLAQEVISVNDYKFKTTELDNEISSLEKQIETSKNSIMNFDKDSIINEITKLHDEAINITELTPEIIHRFISKIEIKENGDARITYRFSHLPFTF